MDRKSIGGRVAARSGLTTRKHVRCSWRALSSPCASSDEVKICLIRSTPSRTRASSSSRRHGDWTFISARCATASTRSRVCWADLWTTARHASSCRWRCGFAASATSDVVSAANHVQREPRTLDGVFPPRTGRNSRARGLQFFQLQDDFRHHQSGTTETSGELI